MGEIGRSLLIMGGNFLQDLSRGVSCFPRSPGIEKYHQHLFDPTMSKTNTIGDQLVVVFHLVGSEKYKRFFPATGSPEKRETVRDVS